MTAGSVDWDIYELTAGGMRNHSSVVRVTGGIISHERKKTLMEVMHDSRCNSSSSVHQWRTPYMAYWNVMEWGTTSVINELLDGTQHSTCKTQMQNTERNIFTQSENLIRNLLTFSALSVQSNSIQWKIIRNPDAIAQRSGYESRPFLLNSVGDIFLRSVIWFDERRSMSSLTYCSLSSRRACRTKLFSESRQIEDLRQLREMTVESISREKLLITWLKYCWHILR